MTDVLDECADDIEALIVAWLQPLGETAAERKSGAGLPFRLVEHVTGTESVTEGFVTEVVAVHTLSDKAGGKAAAAAEEQLTHRRMLLLDRHLEAIDLVSGAQAGIEGIQRVENHGWVPYSDRIWRKVRYYHISLSYETRIAAS